jgi:hypothetical protein
VVANIVLPNELLDATWIDQRSVMLFGFVIFAATCPVALRRREALAAGLVFGALLVARIGIIASVWSAHNADLAAMSRVLTPVEAGSRVLAVRVMDTDALYVRHAEPASRHFFIEQESYWHLPALAVIERKAFWPLIFAEPTKQPIRVLPPYRDLVFDNGVPPSLANLLAAESGNVKLSQPFLQDWRAHYDYVLVLEAGDLRDPAAFDAEHLEFLAGSDIAALYRVRNEAAPARLAAQSATAATP